MLEYTVTTMASVGRIKWRPQRMHHIASCALVIDSVIHVWDVRRPYIPHASFNDHKDITTGIAWRGCPDVLLSTSKVCYNHGLLTNESNKIKYRKLHRVSRTRILSST